MKVRANDESNDQNSTDVEGHKALHADDATSDTTKLDDVEGHRLTHAPDDTDDTQGTGAPFKKFH